jgi:hypothetical protein
MAFIGRIGGDQPTSLSQALLHPGGNRRHTLLNGAPRQVGGHHLPGMLENLRQERAGLPVRRHNGVLRLRERHPMDPVHPIDRLPALLGKRRGDHRDWRPEQVKQPPDL